MADQVDAPHAVRRLEKRYRVEWTFRPSLTAIRDVQDEIVRYAVRMARLRAADATPPRSAGMVQAADARVTRDHRPNEVMGMESTRVALYASVSTDAQAVKGYSLPAQLGECRRKAELANDELKTHLRGAGRILRSKLPDRVRQEVYAYFLTH